MNYTITHNLNSLVGRSVFFDRVVFFSAEVLPYIVGFLFCVLIVFSFKRTILPFLTSLMTLVFVTMVNSLLKTHIGFKRPFQVYETIQPLFITVGLGAFPSGHAIFFSALATLACFFFKKFSYFFVISTLVIGFARIIAGVHFFYDIFAGWILGFLFAWVALFIYKKSIGKQD